MIKILGKIFLKQMPFLLIGGLIGGYYANIYRLGFGRQMENR
jgi:hypothetical protein